MPYIDDDFKPKPYGDLAYNNSGRNLLIYYPWRAGIKKAVSLDCDFTYEFITGVTPTPTATVTVTPTSSITPTPSITPTLTPTPTPSSSPTFIASVSIAPTGSTQYENVILTGSTNISSPTYIWSLTGFTDTSGNTISSYTGNPLTEGYFTSTGSSNVELFVTGTEGTGSSTSFEIIEFTPSLFSSNEVWLDLSDSSSIQTRDDSGTDYITTIENKAANNYMTGFTNSVAAQQWVYEPSGYYTASTRNVGKSDINRISYISNANWTGYTKEMYTIHRIETQTGSSVLPLVGRRNGGERFGLGRRRSDNSPGIQIYASVPASNYVTLYQTNYGLPGSEVGAYNQVEFMHLAFDGTDTAVWYDTLSGNTSGVSANLEYNFTGYTGSYNQFNTKVANTNPDNTEPCEVYYGLDGEIWEVVIFDELLTEEQRLQINRYFYHKWDLANYAEMGVPYSIPLVDKGN